MSYEAIICKIVNIHKHPNADNLNLGSASGYQVVVSKDVEEGTVGVFFPTDGQLSEEMCRENNLYRHTHLNKDPESKSGFFEDSRRVRAIKLRGAKSEGFWTELSMLSWTGADLTKLKTGDLFQELNGKQICNKYYTKATQVALSKKGKTSKNTKIKKYFPDFKEHFNTQQLRMMVNFIPEGAVLSISEKCHGTSGRTGYLKQKNVLSKWKQIWNRIFGVKFPEYEWRYVSGSRRVVISTEKSDEGFYAGTNFRSSVHSMFVEAGLKKGETVYYEIVGFDDNGSSIMGSHGVEDKKLKKVYGNQMVYSYGCSDGIKRKDESDESWEFRKDLPLFKVLIYRITNTLDDGTCYELPYHQLVLRIKELGIDLVPVLKSPFAYDGNSDELMKLCEALSQGSSTLDSKHIKEDVVVRVEAPGAENFYKYKSFHFCELEGIRKNDENYVDPEEVA